MITDRVPTIDDYLKAPAHPLRQKGGHRSIIKKKNDPRRPLVSICTLVKNRKETLSQTILSVLNQTYSNIEYIVIDGASTDSTLEVIKQFDDKIDEWISEPDAGTSEAFNKGVSMAQGDFLFWISSDDWIGTDYIEIAVKTLLKANTDFVFGDMIMYNYENSATVYKGNKNYAKALMSGYPRFNFPTMMLKKECYQKAGLMDTAYNLVADYEWLLRLHLIGGKGFYDGSLVVHRRVGGIGEKYPIRSASELLRILKRYGLPKTKAMAAYSYHLIRKGVGRIVKLLVSDIIYKKLKHSMRKI